LPPISADIFTEKVLQARAASTAEAAKAYFERTCEVCNKSYYSENAYHNHLSSQKHKQNEQLGGQHQDEETRSMISSTFSLGEPTRSTKNSLDSDVEDEFNQVVEGLQKAKLEQQQRPSPVKRPSNPHPVPGINGKAGAAVDVSADRESNSATPIQASSDVSWSTFSCIFCNYESPSAPLNAHHMERFHGMFIPEKPYLVDLDGLLQMLQEQVRVGNQCLYCPKVKTTVFGIQTHA
jgi:pre-60S factor REI1